MRRSLFFLLFLLFPTVVSAVGIKSADGTKCYLVTYNDIQSWTGSHSYRLWYTSSSPANEIAGSPLLLRGDQDATSTGRIGGYLYGLTFRYWNGSSWVGTSAGTGSYSGQFVTQEILDYFHTFVQSVGAVKNSDLPASPPLGFCEDSCDVADDDNDGVCNECDKVPNAPDPEDCILIESIDKNTSQVVGVSIDIGCTNDGTNVQHWTSENYNATTARSYANIGNDKDKIGRENCQTGLPEGQCCAYAPGSKGELYTVGLNQVVMGPPTHEQIIDSLTDLPSPLDLPEKCAGHNDMCSQYCEDKLGVALSSCREDKDGAKISNCECNNTFQVRTKVAPDSEELDKVAAADQALKADSNNNQVPDYADAETQNKPDTDNDGIHDDADVDSTGGADTNGDSIDDQYTISTHATAVASAGLASKDSENLDSIERSTAQTASGVGALKGSVDGLTTEVQGLRSDLATENPEIVAHRAKVAGMIDSFTEENTATIDESQLNSDLFSGLQPSDVPEDPTEDFDVEAFVQEFSFAFPEQLDTLIKGSAVNVSNSDSCIEGIVMGAPFEFCFDKFQSIFMIMGLIFKGLCTFRAMEIIIAGVRL